MKFVHSLLRSLPFCSVLVLIMGGCSLQIGDYPLLPGLFLIPIYYWVMFYPDGLPLWSLFGIGLFYDSLLGSELGVSSILLGASGFLGQYVRPLLASHSFPLIWATFALYSLGYIFLYGIWGGLESALFISWIYGIIFYPLIVWVLNLLHVRLYVHV